MGVDHPITRAEKVSVLKLPAEQRKLRSTILSITTTQRNVNTKESMLMQQLESGMNDEIHAVLFMMIMLVMYVIMVGIVLC